MTTISLNLEVQYRYWYDKAIDYVFDFFEDPLYSDVNEKDFLSKLLLDPKTLLILLTYIAYQSRRLLDSWSYLSIQSTHTNVNDLTVSESTNVSGLIKSLDTVVTNGEIITNLKDFSIQSLQPSAKLNVFLTAYISSLISGWAFLRIFRQLLPKNCKQWEKIIAPFFLSVFRYYLLGPKPSANMPFSGSSFC